MKSFEDIFTKIPDIDERNEYLATLSHWELQEMAHSTETLETLYSVMNDMQSWDNAAAEAASIELCDRLCLDWHSYRDYDQMMHDIKCAMGNYNGMQYIVCRGVHEFRRQNEVIDLKDWTAGEFADCEISRFSWHNNLGDAIAELNDYETTVTDYGHYKRIEMYFIEEYSVEHDQSEGIAAETPMPVKE